MSTSREDGLGLDFRAGREAGVKVWPCPVESSLRMVTLLSLPFLADASTYGARIRASKKSESRLVWKCMLLDCLDGGLINTEDSGGKFCRQVALCPGQRAVLESVPK